MGGERKGTQSPLDASITRRKLLTLAGQSSLGLLLAACAGAAPTATPTRAPAPGPVKDTLTVALAQIPNIVDAHVGAGNEDQILRSVNEHPIVDDYVEFGFRNELATDVKFDSDGNMVMKLREGVVFHGGEQFTADDVKFSIERISNPETKSFRSTFFNQDVIKRVEVLDRLTVKFIVNSPPKPKLYVNLGWLSIMSRSWTEGKTQQHIALNANGTGPYKVVRFVPEQVAELERNEKWWGGSVGFKKINLRFVREVAPRLALGQAGQADVIAALDPDLASEAEKAGMNVVVANTRGPGFVALSNLDDHNVMDPSKPNPLKDIRVRQALNYAIDREAIIKNILKGMAFPMRSWVPQPAMRGYVDPKELTPFTYNPDKAKQLLRDAGYAQGFKNRIIHPEKQWSKVDEIALAIVDQLSEFGIQTKVEPLPGPIWVETFFGSKTAPMHLELGWPTPLDPWLFPDLMTGQFKWFRDAELRQIFDDSFKFTLEETDKGLRRLTKKTWEVCPVIWLWHPAQIWAASPQVFWPEEGTNTQISLFRAKPKT